MKKHMTLRDKIASLSPERQAKINQMTQEAILQIKLSELRKQLNLSQAELAKKIGVSQVAVSKIENNTNDCLQLNTLHKYISAMGGTLRLSVELPSGDTYQLA